MKTNKVYVSTAVGLCALLIAGAPNAQAAFQDTAGHWAESAIRRMNDYHIVNGYQGQFRPDETITRGEMAVVLDHVMRYQQMGDNPYMDLGQDFYTEALLKAGRAGVIQGANGGIRPNDPILREEAVTMMARAFGVQPSKDAVATPDGASVSDWAAGQVSAFVQKGYLSASEPFRPQEPITRAEVVAILNQMLSGYYPMAGSFTETASGTVVVNTQDVALRDMTIGGDLILSEGVQDGDVQLDNVTVQGRVLIRGGGAHSIHVSGKSALGTVVMERDGAAVRLAVEDGAKVKNVTVGEKASEAIVTGEVSAVTVAGSGTLTAQDAKIGTISVTAPDASVELVGKSNVQAVEIAKDAKNVGVAVDKEAAVRTVKADAEGAEISGEGKVSEVKADADHITVDTKDTTVKAAAGTTGITAGGEKVPAGSSSNSTPSKNNSSNSSNSGSSSSHRPSKPKELAIERVESVQNGLVRMTLNRASDKPLTKDQFSILCTGGGKDMTILDVHTTDNRVYDLTTAYYNDNTYQLGIMLEDGKLLTYDFVSKYDCPAITSAEAVRTAPDRAEFSYVSDSSGTFYWLLEPKESTRMLRDVHDEPTAEQIMTDGKSAPMKLHSNTFEITDLEPDTSYNMYYVAKGIDYKVTPVKRIEIAGTEAEKPETGDIQIESVETHLIKGADFLEEHIYFDVQLSQPTEKKLDLSQFKLSCPKDANMSLGRVESDDNQLYHVYLKAGYMIQDNNNFTFTITLDDGKTVTGKFYADITWPDLSGFHITRTESGKASVQFRASEPGKIYWKVLEGSSFGAGQGNVKDPKLVLDGTEQEIKEGIQTLEISFADQADKQNLCFCFVSEDEKGNQSGFWYEDIPEFKPETGDGTTQGSSSFEITDISGKVEDRGAPVGRVHVLDIIFNENKTGAALLTNQNITIKQGSSTIASGSRQIDTGAFSPDSPTKHQVILRTGVLDAGDYTFEATLQDDVNTQVSKEFTVDADGNVTTN